MNKDTQFLFDIIKEVKLYYETPIIYVTQRDYADDLFRALCTLRTAIKHEDRDKVQNIIVDYHLQWVHAVNEIENFKKVIALNPRDNIYQAISYTIDALASRLKYFQGYMEKHGSSLSNNDQANVRTELELVDEMHKEVTHELLEKLKKFRNPHIEDFEFIVRVNDATDDLLTWLDKIYDSLSKLLCNYVKVNVPTLDTDLIKTLKQIVNKLSSSNSSSAKKIIEDLKKKGRELSYMIINTAAHNLEISKVIEKINILDVRIKSFNNEDMSAAVLALTHKKEYLENRLMTLKNLKTTIKHLYQATEVEPESSEEVICVCEDFFTFRIFNHDLPLTERKQLITELCFLFDLAIFGEKNSRKSMISILSAADMKEEFHDDLGTFYIDEYSRKIYKVPDDECLYQPNEMNVLVQVSDDEGHIYFYDDCGRYYTDSKTRQRIYKAHATASEYMMGSTGVLLKTKEERNGITYYYDNFGRYYINENGNHIYREVDTVSEYENDGLGNLVRIRSNSDMFTLCPGDVNVTEDFNYLKQTIGPALRVSIADCIIHQPVDPIKYISMRLTKFRKNIEIKEKRADESEALNMERGVLLAERAAAERAAMEAFLTQVGSEASYDSNILNYTTMHPLNDVSLTTSSTK